MKRIEISDDVYERLKSLTTDYGFFCFLTDRSYFEEIEARLRATARVASVLALSAMTIRQA